MPPFPLWSKCKFERNQFLGGAIFSSCIFLFIFYRNGRPGTSSISDKFKIDWGTYMSSRNDVIYIRLDVRGSKGQSKKALYRHLGGVEVQDQIDTLK